MKGSIANPGVGPHVRQIVTAYQEHNLLDTFYTTLYYQSDTFLNRFFLHYWPAFNKQLQRRALKNIQLSHVKSIRRYELLRIISDKIFSSVIKDLVWEWGELAFDNWVSNSINNQLDWMHTYEHCALSTLQKAKQAGITTFYEQPSLHFAFFQTIAKEQLCKYPELKNAGTELLIDKKSERRNQRRAQELNTCDYIICNSTFTAKTLTDAQVSAKKIITIPLAFPDLASPAKSANVSAKTIFIYAGNQSLGKGTHLLYQAWQKCNFKPADAELWLVGSNQLPLIVREGLGNEVKFIPNLPHADLMQLFSQVDVLILPTLSDGFGMVITEAMAQGLPVITTYNSGGPDVITNGKNGFLLEAGNVEQLAEKIKWCVKNKEQLREIGANALAKAASYSWPDFRKQLIKEITSRIASSTN